MGGVVTRGHPCYQSSGVEPRPTAPTSACHGAKATLKALGVPAQYERLGWDRGRGEGVEGDNNQGVRCQVTGEVQLNVETKRGVETEGHGC